MQEFKIEVSMAYGVLVIGICYLVSFNFFDSNIVLTTIRISLNL